MCVKGNMDVTPTMCLCIYAGHHTGCPLRSMIFVCGEMSVAEASTATGFQLLLYFEKWDAVGVIRYNPNFYFLLSFADTTRRVPTLATCYLLLATFLEGGLCVNHFGLLPRDCALGIANCELSHPPQFRIPNSALRSSYSPVTGCFLS